MAASIFDHNLDKNPANYAPLTPLSFLERAAYVYPSRVSVIPGAQRSTWKETYERSRRLAHALAKRGLGVGDTVAAMLPNIPAMYEAHFGVPMSGAVLNALNTRLDADAIGFMLNHGAARLLLIDKEFSEMAGKALSKGDHAIEVIDDEDPEYARPGRRLGSKTYEGPVAEGDPAWEGRWPAAEWQASPRNFTPGTTGNPNG